MKALAALALIAALLGAAWHVSGHAWRELGSVSIGGSL